MTRATAPAWPSTPGGVGGSTASSQRAKRQSQSICGELRPPSRHWSDERSTKDTQWRFGRVTVDARITLSVDGLRLYQVTRYQALEVAQLHEATLANTLVEAFPRHVPCWCSWEVCGLRLISCSTSHGWSRCSTWTQLC